MEFTWDENKAKENKCKHKGVSFEEAQGIFNDPNMIDEFDAEHSTLTEKRYNAIGLSSKRLLFVVFTAEGEKVIRIISARKAEKDEKELYEKESL